MELGSVDGLINMNFVSEMEKKEPNDCQLFGRFAFWLPTI